MPAPLTIDAVPLKELNRVNPCIVILAGVVLCGISSIVSNVSTPVSEKSCPASTCSVCTLRLALLIETGAENWAEYGVESAAGT